MKRTLYLRNLQKKIKINLLELKKKTSFLLEKEKVNIRSLGLIFLDNKGIVEYNKRYLGKDYPTDVLAFPLQKGEGEILISVERAKEQSSSFKTSLEEEIYLLIIHGILHLIGFDDQTQKEAKRMRKEEKRLLKLIQNGSNWYNSGQV
jgi:probable rRNA maturation factor